VTVESRLTFRQTVSAKGSPTVPQEPGIASLTWQGVPVRFLAEDEGGFAGEGAEVFHHVGQPARLHALFGAGCADDAEELAVCASAGYGDGEQSFLEFVVEHCVGLFAHGVQFL